MRPFQWVLQQQAASVTMFQGQGRGGVENRVTIYPITISRTTISIVVISNVIMPYRITISRMARAIW